MKQPSQPRIFVKPAAGLIVRLPDTFKAIFPDGEWVAETLYIHRRLRAKDLVLAAPQAASESSPEPTTSNEGA